MGIVCTRKFSNSKSKSSRGKSHMDVKILERLNRSWIDKPTWQMPQPPTCQAINPAGPPGLGGVFFWEPSPIRVVLDGCKSRCGGPAEGNGQRKNSGFHGEPSQAKPTHWSYPLSSTITVSAGELF
jgi:hypothetical protein